MADVVAILAAARTGDRAAFAELVQLYQRRVYATAIRLLGNHRDADDVVQETFIRAWRGLANFDGRADVFTWLYRIAINTALNHLRSSGRGARLAQQGQLEADHHGGRPESLGQGAASPEQQVGVADDMRRVVDEIAALSPTLRVTLVLATVEEMSHRQIAEALGIPEGTVAWRVNEARRLLRERLAEAPKSAGERLSAAEAGLAEKAVRPPEKS